MSRLTNRDYLTHRSFLVIFWEERPSSLGELPSYAQSRLHDFFAPSRDLTNGQALKHRAVMTKSFPSLPHSAGRALEALRAAAEGRSNKVLDRHRAATTRTYVVSGKPRTFQLTAVRRPEIDINSLSRAVVTFMQEDPDGELLCSIQAAQARKRRRRDS